MLIRRAPTEAEIAARARELHEQDKGEAGDADAAARKDWEKAKAELEAAEAAAESTDVVPTSDDEAGD